MADAAVAALRERAGGKEEHVPRVPIVTVTQEEMPQWARGIIWDCADPADCRPVLRSSRESPFAGARQLDSGALRAAAATLGWADRDIVAQAGEGGVEVLSGCELLTVLAFNHPSLEAQVGAAEAAVKAHMREEWVAPAPTRPLPF
eukprot:1007166-Pleurochrysis_carterae.AAC.1